MFPPHRERYKHVISVLCLCMAGMGVSSTLISPPKSSTALSLCEQCAVLLGQPLMGKVNVALEIEKDPLCIQASGSDLKLQFNTKIFIYDTLGICPPIPSSSNIHLPSSHSHTLPPPHQNLFVLTVRSDSHTGGFVLVIARQINTLSSACCHLLRSVFLVTSSRQWLQAARQL